ncbi:MAG: diaminopropionate ammonia-lyase [SAR324 cluster bacterium]|uniref:Diaminopropionate ammonia-lyase n=1 Tax=SAR324 cluster bacterium TaxID=2024889 RepID=A0A2A4SWQ2_9DELT|nr:MAG: diaminopropionate ammonia-lyase [SAR324 cluster bacterium]
MKSVRYTFNSHFKQIPTYSESFAGHDVTAFHQSLDVYDATPLVSLPELAAKLGVKQILVKDESKRFGLNAFKGLGASYAIYQFIKRRWENLCAEPFQTERLFDPQLKEKMGEITFTTATDGNHGLAVAWTAQKLQQKAVIYVPENMVAARKAHIRATGAEVVVVNGTYDETVLTAAKAGKEKGWEIISDTAYPGYTEVPEWIMTGYATIFNEIEAQLQSMELSKPNMLFLQAGVGGLAGAAADYYVKKYSQDRPKLICVEPLDADCLLESIISGHGERRTAKGAQNSIMAGLNCGTASMLAWPVIKEAIEFFLAVDDDWAREAMKVLYYPEGNDKKLISGESGAAGLAGLIALCREASLKESKEKLGLNKESVVLLINTEGDTDPENFQKIINH